MQAQDLAEADLEGAHVTVNSQTVDCHGCDCAVGESQTRGSDEGQTSPEKQLELAREMVLRRLERRAYSEAELRELLAKKGIAEEVVDELMAAFTRVGLVDDIAFAESLVETRHTFGHRSKMAVVLELRRKGISTEAIEQATEEIDRESDLEQARTVARLKTRSLAKLEHQVAYRRLAGALARKGFSPSIVAQVVRETLDLLESD